VNRTYADGETAVAGTVDGNYLQTHIDDGEAETIIERLSGGKPQSRYNYLEHKWIFTIPEGNNTTFYANVWQTTSGDNDQFTFSYSLNDSKYTEMFTINNSEDVGNISYIFPPSTSGTIYVRVKDTNQTSGALPLDSISIDYMYIESETQSGTPPSAPTDLSATALSVNQIQLDWVDNAEDEFGYYIYRSMESNPWEMIDTVDANTVTYLDSNVFPDTAYSYHLQAYNGSGVSSNSNTATISTPAGLMLTGSGYKEKAQYLVGLSWEGGTGPAYDIYRDNVMLQENFLGTSYTDPVDSKRNYLYQVCEFGKTAECSNIILIDFNVLK